MYEEAQNASLKAFGGTIGVLYNGAMLYSPYAGSSIGDAVDYSTSATANEGDTFDECGGHSSSSTRASYHVHNPPGCLISQLDPDDTTDAHSPQLGWAFDGFPVYGPRGPGGIMMQSCDETGGTYGVDVCTNECAGYWSNDGSIDTYVYRYYIMGDYSTSITVSDDDDTCDNPLNPLPGSEYFPFTPNCFYGCNPIGDTMSIDMLKTGECSSSATTGYIDAAAIVDAMDALDTNTDTCSASDDDDDSSGGDDTSGDDDNSSGGGPGGGCGPGCGGMIGGAAAGAAAIATAAAYAARKAKGQPSEEEGRKIKKRQTAYRNSTTPDGLANISATIQSEAVGNPMTDMERANDVEAVEVVEAAEAGQTPKRKSKITEIEMNTGGVASAEDIEARMRSPTTDAF
jgi:hypothetical protein